MTDSRLPRVNAALVAACAVDDAVTNAALERNVYGTLGDMAAEYNDATRRGLDEVTFLNDVESPTDGAALVFAATARVRPVLDRVRLGDGVTWWRLASHVPAADIETRMAAADLAAMDIDPKSRVQVTRGLLGPDDVEFIVVHGGDSAALATFMAGVPEDATFADFATGDGALAQAYKTLVAAARARRLADARTFAATLSLTLVDGEKSARHCETTSVWPATMYTAQRARLEAAPVDYYVLFARAINPATATDGVFLDLGPFGGGSVYEGELVRDSMPTCAFENPVYTGPAALRRSYSVFPASTGVVQRDAVPYARSIGRRLTADETASVEDRERFARRVRWSGPVQAFNDDASAVYLETFDSRFTDGVLKPLLRTNKPPMRLYVLATYMRGVEPTHASLSELGTIATRICERVPGAGKTTLPVATTTLLDALARERSVRATVSLATLFAAACDLGTTVLDVPLDTLIAMSRALHA